MFGLSEDKFCGPEKSAKAVLAKEVLILIARERGAAVTELSLIAGLDTSNISRRHDAAREKLQTDRKLVSARDQVGKIYPANIAQSSLKTVSVSRQGSSEPPVRAVERGRIC